MERRNSEMKIFQSRVLLRTTLFLEAIKRLRRSRDAIEGFLEICSCLFSKVTENGDYRVQQIFAQRSVAVFVEAPVTGFRVPKELHVDHHSRVVLSPKIERESYDGIFQNIKIS